MHVRFQRLPTQHSALMTMFTGSESKLIVGIFVLFSFIIYLLFGGTEPSAKDRLS